ncbi:MAG: PIG-L deacetylase family protein [Acidobacteriota bacterium]|jgi:LmbE family N-acetylglucosaminyl deacetylase
MDRRHFLGTTMSSSLMLGHPQTSMRDNPQREEIVLERDQPGQPHRGKVLAAIQPHCDDLPLFAGGTILKLIREGYTGILIRTSNDEMAGRGATVGEVVRNNEVDNFEVARRLGLSRTFDLHYRNHEFDAVAAAELRHRLIFIFRLMKVDTVVCYDPWGHYEENPDHYVTARCVEAACWMAGGQWDLPEHFAAGLQPQAVREKYYFARGPQQVNRVVDISSVFEQKIEVNLANVTQGPAGENGAALRQRLAEQRLRLPILGNDDATANREYIRQIVLREDAELGRRHGMAYAEPFHYIGPKPSMLDDYIRQNAVPL